MISDRSLSFPRLLEAPLVTAGFKREAADFQVVEELGFTPEGGGEHIYLRIRKTGQNTAWVATQLAAFAGVRALDVNFSGRKDRHAITEQWFSCWKPGKDMPDFESFCQQHDGLELLEVQRYNKKLRRGSHQANKFTIRLRNLHCDSLTSESSAHSEKIRDEIEVRLRRLQSDGFANYFGEQRFGKETQNLQMADKLFCGEKVPRVQRDMYLSAARSYMFNSMLGQMIETGEYHVALENASLELSHATQSIGRDGIKNDEPRGWLYGKSRVSSAAAVMRAYECVFSDWAAGLTKVGMKAQLRDLRVMPRELRWHFDGADLALSFSLPTGSFATEFLKELVIYGE